jgi:large subunit ribosomal protein L1
MAKKKAELLQEAKDLKLELTEKNTVAEIVAALEATQKETPVSSEVEKPVIAKAGKRSAKSIREQTEEEEKETRKNSTDAQEQSKPKQTQNPTRTKLERRSKGYRKAVELIQKDKQYQLKEALELATKTSYVSFDATVELHVRLNVNPKQADQNIRDSVVLPAGTGKTIRVAVFADADDVAEAKKAGADIAQSDDFLIQLDKGTIDFDVLIATPDMMPKLGKYARVLGPKGLMPNPKSGTVTKQVGKAVKEARAGKLEYRVDETGIVHTPIGKVSFGAGKLASNANVLLESIKSNKPASIKGSYVRSIYLTTSMGPSIQVLVSEL